MSAAVPLTSAHAMRMLAAFLKETDSRRLPAEVAHEAITDWIARQRGRMPNVVIAPDDEPLAQDGAAARAAHPPVPNGYRWKTIFLPHGTRLRMHTAAGAQDGVIQNGELVFNGRRMSPRQMTIAAAGDGYNAWRSLWLLLPDSSRWKNALQLRREVEQKACRARGDAA